MEPGLKRELYSKYDFCDMQARYIQNENGNIELLIIPLGREQELVDTYKISRGDSIIQVKLVGDQYPGTLSGGTTMRNSQTTEKLRLLSQEVIDTMWENKKKKTVIKTTMTDDSNHLFIHYLGYTQGDYAFDSYTEFINESDEIATLELLSSFSISEVTPFTKGEAADAIDIHRIRSKWSHEARLITESAADLQLEMSWVGWHVNSVRYGSIGSMPVKKYSPFGAIEDTKAGVIWASQLMIESSWDMEFYRRDEAIAFSGGIADREFGEWKKNIAPGEHFITPVAIITVCEKMDDSDEVKLVDYACQRMTHYINKFVNEGPEAEQHLPVLFNEYCTTWGLPSYDNIDGILKAIKGHGLEYFVIDCGWFVEEGKNWGDGMGDYVPSKILFPNGLKSIADRIREDGLRPGIWFEIDNVGKDSHVYSERPDLLLTRDGITLTTKSRRFLDMRKSKVTDYLDNRVINQLCECGFEYMKMDYNDTIGLGVDGAESLGEGLRAVGEASVNYVRRVKEKIPQIILENCASGGHRLEPLMMSLCSMASFSDAHECEHIPSIAGGLHRTILPRQSQIWAVIRKEADLKRIGWVLASALLGRMCFSGDVTELSDEQWDAIDKGIAFYKKSSEIIKNGYTYIYDHKGASDRALTGYQAYIRKETKANTLDTSECKRALATAYIYDKQDEIRIKLPVNCPATITDIYSTTDISAHIDGDDLVIIPKEGKQEAIALLLGE